MKAIHFFALVFVLVFVFTGCDVIDDVVNSVFGSDEAEILTFDIDGIVGKAEIDSENKTVDLTVEPMDISGVEPIVTVSENATITTEKLVDGQAVILEVTAENGDVVSWEVTVNVQHGISFTYKSVTTKVVFTAGAIDSEDSDNNDLVGDGVPSGNVRYGSSTGVFAFEEEYDTSGDYLPSHIGLFFFGLDTGDYTTLFYYILEGNKPFFIAVDDEISSSISKYGKVGGNIIGTFSGTGAEKYIDWMPSGKEHEITDGFFKVRRIENEVFF